MQQQQDQMPPEEAQEYIGKLQAGRSELPAEASPLEQEMLRTLTETSRRVRELNTRKSDVEKQVEALNQQVTGLGTAIAEVSGEMGGYARMLVSAEWSRRKATKAAEKAEAAAAAEKEAPPEGEKAPEAPGAKPPSPTPIPSKPNKS